VHAVLEVTTAQVDTDSHVLGNVADAIVVELDVSIENRFRVDTFLLHTTQHSFRAEVSEERIIELNVAASSFVKVGELFSVSFGEIIEVVPLVGVDRVVTSVLSVTKVVPFGSGQSKLRPERECEHADTSLKKNQKLTLTFLTSSGLTIDFKYSNSGRYIGLLRTSFPWQTIVSPGFSACDSKKALMSGTYLDSMKGVSLEVHEEKMLRPEVTAGQNEKFSHILKISRGGLGTTTIPSRLLWKPSINTMRL
jgi:hypothetical protein